MNQDQKVEPDHHHNKNENNHQVRKNIKTKIIIFTNKN